MTSSELCPKVAKALEYLGEGRLEKFMRQWTALEDHYGPAGAIELLRSAGVPAMLDGLAHRHYVNHGCSEAQRIMAIVSDTFGTRPLVAA